MYRLLIVDDEPKIVEGMKRIINWKNYGINQILTASNYDETIEKAMEFKPHIGIFDVCIDDIKGYDIIEKLNKFSLPTKYIMISGYDEFEYACKAIRAGAKDYLMKPIDKEELKKAVEKIIVEDFNGSINMNASLQKNIDPVLGIEYSALSNLVSKVILIVKEKYNKNINLKMIADKFKMNSNYLGQIFSKETHMKFSEYLMVYRLMCAKEKIITTSEKICYIARQVGYTNMNYFYTQFRNYFNVSPSDFRNLDKIDKSTAK